MGNDGGRCAIEYISEDCTNNKRSVFQNDENL
jgi:hypothetical protein